MKCLKLKIHIQLPLLLPAGGAQCNFKISGQFSNSEGRHGHSNLGRWLAPALSKGCKKCELQYTPAWDGRKCRKGPSLG